MALHLQCRCWLIQSLFLVSCILHFTTCKTDKDIRSLCKGISKWKVGEGDTTILFNPTELETLVAQCEKYIDSNLKETLTSKGADATLTQEVRIQQAGYHENLNAKSGRRLLEVPDSAEKEQGESGSSEMGGQSGSIQQTTRVPKLLRSKYIPMSY